MARPLDREQCKGSGTWAYWLGIGMACLFVVFATHPFLRLSYDPWEHLIKIRSIFDTGECFLFWPENVSTFCAWHRTWAAAFSFLHISDALAWARIIHLTQSLLAILCVFYFSSTSIKLCAREASPNSIRVMALMSTLFWLVGNGTFSGEYQQAWIMWYSVTYQGMTIPLFWLMTALLLQASFADTLAPARRWIYGLLCIPGILVIIKFHPSEAIYVFIFLCLAVLFTPFLSPKQKIGCALAFLLLALGLFYLVDSYPHLNYLKKLIAQQGIQGAFKEIVSIGPGIVENNRQHNTFSELAVLSSVAALVYWCVFGIWFRDDSSRFVTLLCASLVIFYLIPSNIWLAGTTGLLLHKDIVWRFFFGSPWFIFLPLIALKFTQNRRLPEFAAPVLLLGLFCVTLFASQIYLNQALTGNARSLLNSFFKDRVGLQYSQDSIEHLKKIIMEETKDLDKDSYLLYLRGDMATIARALYGYYAYSHRRVFLPMHSFFGYGLSEKYELVPITLPPEFPKDPHIFTYFNLDLRSISQKQQLEVVEGGKVLFRIESVDRGERYLFVSGWAFLESQLGDSSVYVILESDKEVFIYDSSTIFRREIGQYFKSAELDNTGFIATIPIRDLAPGSYRVGLLVRQDNKEGFTFTNSSTEISTGIVAGDKSE